MKFVKAGFKLDHIVIAEKIAQLVGIPAPLDTIQGQAELHLLALIRLVDHGAKDLSDAHVPQDGKGGFSMKFETRFETLKLADIIPAPYNPREDIEPGTEEYKRLRKSLEDHGLGVLGLSILLGVGVICAEGVVVAFRPVIRVRGVLQVAVHGRDVAPQAGLPTSHLCG